MSNWLVAVLFDVSSQSYRLPTASAADSPAAAALPEPRGRGAVGLISVVIGGLALARSAGRIGTGNGRLGAIVALVVGLIGMALGGLIWPPPPVVSAPAAGEPGPSWPWWWG